MPVASSQYWNSIHGAAPGEALKDAEGLQIMRTLAKNMSFLIKSIQLGKEEYGLPEKEKSGQDEFCPLELTGYMRRSVREADPERNPFTGAIAK